MPIILRNTTVFLGMLVATAANTATWTHPVLAQSQHAITAEALFDQGRKLMEAGDYEQACPKFVGNQRLDPTSCTLLNIGTCYENLGRTTSAWTAFKDLTPTPLPSQ